MTRLRSSRAAGFTLLELIVAAGILALIAVFSWRGLDALIREREAIAASQATIDVLQRAFARLERDALLARDVELDGAGAMRLVAGAATADGADATTVEYRLGDGVLTRAVSGVDRAPLVMIGGIASLVLEAWTPAPRGGAWVRTKGAAVEPPPQRAPNAPGAGGANAPQAATQASAQASAQTSPGTSPPAGTPPSATQAAPATALAAVPAATGVRLTFALSDGTTLVRAFIVGGA